MRAAGVLLAAALAATPALGARVQDDPAPPPVGGQSTLDRTLQVDTDAPQRNEQLLLEIRQSGLAEIQPGAPRPVPADGVPGLRPAPAAAMGADAAAEPREPPRAAVPGAVRQAAQFLRAHRNWLLGGALLAVVVVLAGAAWQRRRTGTAAQRLKVLAAQREVTAGRRRRRAPRD
jgi:hypothetical protein